VWHAPQNPWPTGLLAYWPTGLLAYWPTDLISEKMLKLKLSGKRDFVRYSKTLRLVQYHLFNA